MPSTARSTTLIAVLTTLLAVSCAHEPQTSELDQLRDRARAQHAERLASTGALRIETRTEVGVNPASRLVFTASSWQQAGRSRLEAWLGAEESTWGWIEMHDHGEVTIWPVDKFGWERLTPDRDLQHRALDAWYDHAALSAAELLGTFPLDGRQCHALRIPTEEIEGHDAYRFDAVTDARVKLDELEASGLQIIRAELQVEGRAEVYTAEGLAQVIRGLRDSAHVVPGRLWAIEADPMLLYTSAESFVPIPGEPDPAAGYLSGFEVISELCIDSETLRPLRVDGVLRDHRYRSRRPATLVWSDFRPVDGHESMAHRQDLLLGETPFATVTLTEVATGEQPPADTFDVHAVGPYLDAKMQEDNKQSVLNYVAAGTHDGTETEDPDDPASVARDELFRPEALLDRLGVQPGDDIADIGAGTGYFTFRFARAIGPRGRAYAVDVNPHAVAFIEERGQDPALNPHRNVRGIVNRFDDANLPEASVDLGFVCWAVLHRFRHLSEDNQRLLDSFYRACRPGGRWAVLEEHPLTERPPALPLGLAVLEIGRHGTDIGTLDPAGMLLVRRQRSVVTLPVGPDGLTASARNLRTHYEAAGFEFVENIDHVDGHDLMVFRRPGG
jgi:SAM-dependent methyltransferase